MRMRAGQRQNWYAVLMSEFGRQLIHRVGSRGMVAFPLACAMFAAACHVAADPRGMPLYAATAPLARDAVAELTGPIAKVDGRVVIDQGGSFEVLPGCHVVELDRRMNADTYSVTGGVYLTGQYPETTYVIRMKAGARYTIQRSLPADSMSHVIHVRLSAREEEPSGKVTELFPMRDAAEIHGCVNNS
jgi:hypothetical protein